jgi:anti-sigma regulatory factor (Ser/Thr protein kinase)
MGVVNIRASSGTGRAGTSRSRASRFRHEAFFYESQAEYFDGLAGFVNDGLDLAEPVMVAINRSGIHALRRQLGLRRARAVQFVEMPAVGANPSRIIPIWRSFVSEFGSADQAVRGVGEPVWPGRTPAELDECHFHEALLNHAFGNAPGWLLCPYDVSALDPNDVAKARATHPLVLERGAHAKCRDYAASDVSDWFSAPLAEPPVVALARRFDAPQIAELRALVNSWAAGFGVAGERIGDLALAVSEAAGNSVRYAGGGGTLRLWATDHDLVAEVTDAGQIADPLVGRARPDFESFTGRGLWLVNQVCDLVELRNLPTGVVVRMHVSR